MHIKVGGKRDDCCVGSLDQDHAAHEEVDQRQQERRERLRLRAGTSGKPWRDMHEYLETEIWPLIPAELRGKPPMTKAEVEEILSFGPEGY